MWVVLLVVVGVLGAGTARAQAAEEPGSGQENVTSIDAAVYAMSMEHSHHGNYQAFHDQLRKDQDDVLAKVGEQNGLSLASVQNSSPVKLMFQRIEQGSALIDNTRNFRKQLKANKPFALAKPSPTSPAGTQQHAAMTQQHVALLGALGGGVGPEGSTGANSQQTTLAGGHGVLGKRSEEILRGLGMHVREGGAKKKKKEEDPFSVGNVVRMLQSWGGDDDEDDQDFHPHHHHHHHHHAHSYSHAHAHSNPTHTHTDKGTAKREVSDVAGKDLPLPVYAFLEQQVEIRHHRALTPQEILAPKPPAVHRQTTRGTRPSGGQFDKESLSTAHNGINTAKSTSGLSGEAMLLPLLTVALSSGAFGSPTSSDSLTQPDPFAQVSLAQAPSTDWCYSLEEKWINECASPPTVYLQLGTTETHAHGAVQDAQRGSGVEGEAEGEGEGKTAPQVVNPRVVRRAVARKLMFEEVLRRLAARKPPFGDAAATAEQGVSLLELTSHLRGESGGMPKLATAASQQQQQLSSALASLLAKARPSAPGSRPAGPGGVDGEFERMLARLFEGVQEAVDEKVSPDDEPVAAAHSTAGLAGMQGFTKGVGALLPIMGMVNPTSNNVLARHPDYYDPGAPDGGDPSELQVSGGERCNRLLDTWTFKCAVSPM